MSLRDRSGQSQQEVRQKDVSLLSDDFLANMILLNCFNTMTELVYKVLVFVLQISPHSGKNKDLFLLLVATKRENSLWAQSDFYCHTKSYHQEKSVQHNIAGRIPNSG